MRTTEMPTTEMKTFNVPALPDDAKVLFTDPAQMEEHLQSFRDLVASSQFNVATAKGRAEAKSLAYAISQHKVALDDFGKSLTEDMKKAIGKVDLERRKARETLDELRDQAKGEALAWEAKEAERQESLELRMQAFAARPAFAATAIEISAMLEQVQMVEVNESWEERYDDAVQAKTQAIGTLTDLLAERINYEAEQEELIRLRAEAAERLEKEKAAAEAKAAAERQARLEAEQKAREEAAAAAAAARERQAAAEAVAKAKAEQWAAEEAKKEAEEAKKEAERRAEREAKAAAERAERAAAEAAAAERARIAQEAAAKKASDEKALAQKKRRDRIKGEITAAIVPLVGQAKTREDLGGLIAEEIISGRMPWVKINL